MNAVSGTLGLTGAADAVLVLQRPRGMAEGKLFITGRDLEERSIALRFDPQYFAWFSSEESKDGLTPERKKVIEALTKAGRPQAPIDMARLLNKPYETVKKLLQRMFDEGFLGRKQGLYYDVSQNRPDEQPEEAQDL